ncbi:hypothetical protein G7B40_040150 [Aetokthonos hydrillicola Thurmond2011]|jgi:hypothetical protein|uniref:Uncharacterized protein n=1 Tax=Aetokthonos hydrillicola Thurmond2011 TaxID=2712845 RepID=A0AAP5IHF7_9CYAN|nr:hypothetical protein [Aetokthonos hydrillicola]MBO3459941.1 hypothetical protein [Aetokthonos hydrillicola CCALA 1050]MBW4584060.1 hypothetical protein [Aetokthonos hydrillicola CCALA 1050]MDR9900702.1 hypothetical protein [Aetokthonos hydrillicola Thurmond2011]
MAITLELTRPKLVTTNAANSAISVGTVVETDTSQEDSFFIPINLASTDPPAFTVSSSTTTSGSNTVTTTNNGFSGVKVGDVVTGTGIAASTTVTAKTDNNTITLNNNATASGTVTLTFDPPAVTPTLYALKVTHTKAGSVLGLNVTLYTYSGTLGGTAGTATNAAKTINLASTDGQPVQINMDTFLTNLRVPQSP